MLSPAADAVWARSIASVGQAGQRIVQGIEFDARPGRFEFGVARFGKLAGAFKILLGPDFVGNVPVHAQETRHAVEVAIPDAFGM